MAFKDHFLINSFVIQRVLMKKFVVCLFAMLLSIAAFAQTSEQQIEEQKAALERAIDNYGKVYGAWLVEKQCSYLSDSQKEQLKHDLHIIQEAIPLDPAIQNMHLMVEDSAKEVASTPPFSDCGKESEALIRQATTLASDWANIIRSTQPKT
jgi:hypothetical protein